MLIDVNPVRYFMTDVGWNKRNGKQPLMQVFLWATSRPMILSLIQPFWC